MCEVSGSLRLLFFAFSSSADETSFTPCLKSRLFFFSALEYSAGGMDEAFWRLPSPSPSPLFPIFFYQPLIIDPSPPPHHMGPSPFKPKTATLTISNRLYHPPFLPPPFFPPPAIM